MWSKGGNMAKEARGEKVEIAAGNSPWLPILAISTIMFSAGLVTVIVMTYVDLHDLDTTDALLQVEIEALQRKLESTLPESRTPVKEVIDAEDEVMKTEASHINTRAQPQSFFDVLLQAQEQIFEKYCHLANSTCPDGAVGEKGVTGDPGTPGATGATGADGAKGDRGDPGAPGFKGPRGSKGPNGTSGLPGPRGLQGLKGFHGDTGPAGLPGKTGLAGLKGPKGVRGDTGLTGNAGPRGDPGSNGQKGDRGDPGYQGPEGDAGPRGSNGTFTKKFGDHCECLNRCLTLSPQNPQSATKVQYANSFRMQRRVTRRLTRTQAV